MGNTTPNYGFPTPDGNAIAEFDTQNIVAGMIDTELHNVATNTAQARTDAQEALTRSIAANDASVIAGGQAASAITAAQGAQNTATSAVTIANDAKLTANNAKGSADSALTLVQLVTGGWTSHIPTNPNPSKFTSYQVYSKRNSAMGILNIYGQIGLAPGQYLTPSDVIINMADFTGLFHIPASATFFNPGSITADGTDVPIATMVLYSDKTLKVPSVKEKSTYVRFSMFLLTTPTLP